VPYILLVPVVGIAASWIVQGEVPDAVELTGGAIMLIGVGAAVLRGRRPAVASPA
jgi:O-acetylserine/cysteine efflux transporter